MLNRTIIIARLAADVELRYTGTGQAVCNFTLAVDNGYGERKQTSWVDCVAWGKTAENMAQYTRKGMLIAVEGHIQTRSYETKEGQKRKAVEVVADTVKFLERGEGKSAPAKVADDWSDLGTDVTDEFESF